MSTNPNPTPTAGTVPTNTPEAPASGAEPSKGGVVAPPLPGSDASAAGAGEAVKPAADPKAARLALKEQEATRKLNAERAALQQERERIAAENKATVAAMEAEFKANPMAFAKKYGVSYEDITKAAIAEASATTPEARIAALEEERRQEREAAETARKAAEAKRQQEEAQGRVTAYVDGIHGAAAKEPAKYALVNALEPTYAKGLIFDVADLMAIERQKNGDRTLPTAGEVLEKIEIFLDAEADRLAKAKAAKAPKPAAGAPGAAGAAPAEGDPEVAALVAQRNAAAKKPPKNLTNRATQAPAAPPPKTNGNGKMSRDEAIKAAIAAGLAAAKG